ncbi:LacI family transcriptional regulator [Anseongella ginsenosidimutans]|uniref:LacI family transcriptional regulator n=1 Tax=Anseongella ginsenosidimutans TaxID=496056 RepID=A0A4R3KVK8_9SPHI|nr:LacI family DNA-binding transcriptional regulator [Anseongella ginsenosidimutans]QEC51631.1 LacI family transcriptional regulator [Anseongella ginsenosidimutans]TCS88964.1 LacI family transcriptional regulator [Anseongella ginsenosidimutans]
MITIKELAQRLNLSPSTVSKALHDYPGIGLVTKEKVKALAKELHYVPNQAAIHFKQQKTFTLGVILPSLLDQFYSLAVNGIENYTMDHDYSVLICQSHENVEREKQLLSIMQRNRVDGLIISVTKNTTDYSHITDLQRSGVPVVFFVRKPTQLPCHNVTSDVYKGALEAVELLIKRGHRRIGYINGPVSWVASTERFLGYRDALLQHEIAYDPTLVKVSDLTSGGNHGAIKALLASPQPPTAILAFKDYVMLDALQYLKKARAATDGQAIEFIGFGALPLFEYLDKQPLASIQEQPYQIGEKAANLLLDLIRNPGAEIPFQQVALPCNLKVY